MKTLQKYPAYKNSQIKWLGCIPKNWQCKRFKFIFSFQKGKMPKKIITENISMPKLPVYMDMEYLRGGNATQWVLDNKVLLVNEGEILLLWDGANAGEFLKSREGVVGSTISTIEFLSRNIHKKYAWFYFKFLEMELRKRTIGMGIPHVSSNYLNNLQVLIPTMYEQIQIANFLDKKVTLIDKAIEKKEKLIEILKEHKQIVIQNTVTKGLNPNVKMKKSDFEWIGKIPEHWKIKRCKYLFFEVHERSSEGKEELLSVSHVTGVTPRAEKNVNMFLAEDYSGSKLCKPGDIVINTMWAWMGALGISKIEGIVSPSYGVYRQIENDSFNSLYLEALLKTTGYIAYYNKISTGLHSSRLRFYPRMFFNMKIGFPPKSEQDRIVFYIETQSAKIDKAIHLEQEQIEKLKEYKTVLIHNAVTGKIKVC